MDKSKCCEAPVKVVGGSEGTNHYECTKCGKACDLVTGTDHCVQCGAPLNHEVYWSSYKTFICDRPECPNFGLVQVGIEAMRPERFDGND